MEILSAGVSIDGKEIDILGFLPDGSLVVVELKREKGSRETIAQAIDYASKITDLDTSRLSDSLGKEVEKNLEDNLERRDMERSDVKEKPRIMIVASEIDEATRSMIDYLSEMYEVPINGIVFSYSKLSDGSEIISRTAVAPEEEMEERVSLTSRELENIAEENGIDEIVETLRKTDDFLKKEEPYDAVTLGKSFRYWKVHDDEWKMTFGIRVGDSENGRVLLWVRQENIGNIDDSEPQAIVSELKEKFEIDHTTTTRTDIAIRNNSEAEEFVNWLRQKVTT